MALQEFNAGGGMGMSRKETNPKDAVGVRKVPTHVVPQRVIGETGLALLEGARKYGAYNWRAAGVRASVYYDAVVSRHLAAWWEGEDTDADSGLSHITKAIAGLTVLRDSMMHGNWQDDRPIKAQAGWVQEMNTKAGEIIDKYPDAKAPFTEKSQKPKVRVKAEGSYKVPAKKLYLAGPMRNIKDFNFPAFMEAAKLLRADGFEVFNPAEADIKRNGPDTNKSETGSLDEAAGKGFSLRAALSEDMQWIAEEADAIALLPGWTRSPGAKAEWALAQALGLEEFNLRRRYNLPHPVFVK